MGKTTTALIIKLVMTFVASWIAVSLIAGNNWTWALIVAVLGTLVNYLLGDLYVLPNYGNIVASIADGVLAMVLLFLVDMATTGLRVNGTAYLVLGVLIAAGEYFFHNYLIGSGIVDKKSRT